MFVATESEFDPGEDVPLEGMESGTIDREYQENTVSRHFKDDQVRGFG